MFTGIVGEVGRVITASPGELCFSAGDTVKGLSVGGSIAVNGACLTVTSFDAQTFSVDIMPETLKRTNLGLLVSGSRVNLELPLVMGGQLGGHLVQGHVDVTGRVTEITRDGEALIFDFAAPAEVMRYIVEKGFVAVDGVSLTVISKTTGSFKVSVVGHTREQTILGNRRAGDLVNLEVDIMAKYAEQLSQPPCTGITTEFLHEHGLA